MYRQYTLQALTQRPAGPPQRSFVNPAAYADVVQAWRTYLRKYNHGRGVVLIGHSQGTLVLRQVIAKEIDPKPAARRLLVSAVLLGGNVLVKRGEDVGGDFQHIPACRAAGPGRVRRGLLDLRPAGAGRRHLRTHHRQGHERPVHEPGGAARRRGRARPGLSRQRPSRRARRSPPASRCSASPSRWRRRRGSSRRAATSARCTSGAAHVLMIAPRGGAPTPNAVARPDLGPASDRREHRAGEPHRPRRRAGRGVRGPVGLPALARGLRRGQRDRCLGRRDPEAEALDEVQLDVLGVVAVVADRDVLAALEQEVAAAQAERRPRRRRRAPTRAARRGSCAGGRRAGSRRARWSRPRSCRPRGRARGRTARRRRSTAGPRRPARCGAGTW